MRFFKLFFPFLYIKLCITAPTIYLDPSSASNEIDINKPLFNNFIKAINFLQNTDGNIIINNENKIEINITQEIYINSTISIKYSFFLCYDKIFLDPSIVDYQNYN